MELKHCSPRCRPATLLYFFLCFLLVLVLPCCCAESIPGKDASSPSCESGSLRVELVDEEPRRSDTLSWLSEEEAGRLKTLIPSELAKYSDQYPAFVPSAKERELLLRTAKPLTAPPSSSTPFFSVPHILIGITSLDTVELSKNWACALLTLNITNFCFISLDLPTHWKLGHRLNYCSIFVPFAHHNEDLVEDLDHPLRSGEHFFGTNAFHAVAGLKHLFPYHICNEVGLAVSVADSDVIFRRDFRKLLVPSKPTDDLVDVYYIHANSGFMHHSCATNRSKVFLKHLNSAYRSVWSKQFNEQSLFISTALWAARRLRLRVQTWLATPTDEFNHRPTYRYAPPTGLFASIDLADPNYRIALETDSRVALHFTNIPVHTGFQSRKQWFMKHYGWWACQEHYDEPELPAQESIAHISFNEEDDIRTVLKVWKPRPNKYLQYMPIVLTPEFGTLNPQLQWNATAWIQLQISSLRSAIGMAIALQRTLILPDFALAGQPAGPIFDLKFIPYQAVTFSPGDLFWPWKESTFLNRPRTPKAHKRAPPIPVNVVLGSEATSWSRPSYIGVDASNITETLRREPASKLAFNIWPDDPKNGVTSTELREKIAALRLKNIAVLKLSDPAGCFKGFEPPRGEPDGSASRQLEDALQRLWAGIATKVRSDPKVADELESYQRNRRGEIHHKPISYPKGFLEELALDYVLSVPVSEL